MTLPQNIVILLSAAPCRHRYKAESSKSVFVTYSTRAPNTKRMQASIHASMAVRPSALGVLVVTLLKMFTSTRNSVTNRAIRPGMTSMGIRNEIQDTITKSPGKSL